jgi:hypothetical protein
MADLPHLRIEGTEHSAAYTTVVAGPVNSTFRLPVRNQPVHATRIRSELVAAETAGKVRRAADAGTHPELVSWVGEGLVLTFMSDPNHELKLESLEDRSKGILLLSLAEVENCRVAKVFVPEGKLERFLVSVDGYATSVVLTYEAEVGNGGALKALEDPDRDVKFRGPIRDKNGLAKLRFIMPESERAGFEARVGAIGTLVKVSRPNTEFVESIASVRLALIEDFWQDRRAFPAPDTNLWWEVWLRGNRADAAKVHSRFARIAQIVGVSRVSDRHVAFPERIVVHAFGSARQLAASVDLLSMLAELRKAKILASHFIDRSSADQAAGVKAAAERLVLPRTDAPTVCVLDSGVNRGHPLIGPVLAVADAHAADPAWGVGDSHPYQHGTGMAGIATYGCLTEVLGNQDPIVLRNRLESVKILPPPPAVNAAPDYGRVMQDGVAKATIQAPRRNRAICMAVTADHGDEGLPSLWSGAVDDMVAGVLDDRPKLMFVSAGNIREEFHHKAYSYHAWNITRAGIEDPGQAWNALTIGAVTDQGQRAICGLWET